LKPITTCNTITTNTLHTGVRACMRATIERERERERVWYMRMGGGVIDKEEEEEEEEIKKVTRRVLRETMEGWMWVSMNPTH
jgi:hypothetical protein